MRIRNEICQFDTTTSQKGMWWINFTTSIQSYPPAARAKAPTRHGRKLNMLPYQCTQRVRRRESRAAQDVNGGRCLCAMVLRCVSSFCPKHRTVPSSSPFFTPNGGGVLANWCRDSLVHQIGPVLCHFLLGATKQHVAMWCCMDRAGGRRGKA